MILNLLKHNRLIFLFFSTVSEAIKCSRLMKAEHTILTHISSRHLFPCKFSFLPDQTSFAFDHLTVSKNIQISLKAA